MGERDGKTVLVGEGVVELSKDEILLVSSWFLVIKIVIVTTIAIINNDLPVKIKNIFLKLR